MRDEIYDRVRQMSIERRISAKTSGKIQKLNLLDQTDGTRFFFTIGMEETPRKYEFVVTSKRKVAFINLLIDAIDQRLSQVKQETLHWARLCSQKSFEIVFPISKEYDQRLHQARVTIVPANYNDINHEVKGLLHAIYGKEINLARVKIHEVPNEDRE